MTASKGCRWQKKNWALGYLTEGLYKSRGREAEEKVGCPDQGLWARVAISRDNCIDFRSDAHCLIVEI